MNFAQQFSQIENSVIRIIALEINGTTQTIKSFGSGVLFGDGTHALTCSHCIKPNTTTVGLHSNANQGQIGTVVFQDATLDIAIVQFQTSLGAGVPIRSSATVAIGNEAFAVGFPISSNTVTALSAHIAGFEIVNNIQHIKIDASVNHGNSGGPLFNMDGELIGIINTKKGNFSDFLTAIENAPQGGAMMVIGGVDPVQTVKQLIKEMKANLNLGIGTAIPTDAISQATSLISDIIV